MLDPAKLKKRKRKEDDSEGLSEVKKRRMPPGHIPFRRIKIPEQWKKDMRGSIYYSANILPQIV